MSDNEIDALAEEACPCVWFEKGYASCWGRTLALGEERCAACIRRPAVAAAIHQAIAANDAEWKARIERVQIADAAKPVFFGTPTDTFDRGVEALRRRLMEGR